MSTPNYADEDVVLALALASGKSSIAAAEQLGISERTVRRKLALPEFRTLVADLRTEYVSTALGRMVNEMTRAADVISALLDSPEPTIRLRAASALFRIALRLRDSIELSNQIHEIQVELARRDKSAA